LEVGRILLGKGKEEPAIVTLGARRTSTFWAANSDPKVEK